MTASFRNIFSSKFLLQNNKIEDVFNKPTPDYKNYVYITNIGKETDDILTLFTLLYHHINKNINLEAIVVSGCFVEERYNIMVYWLMKFNVNNIPVIISRDIRNLSNIKDDDMTCNKPYLYTDIKHILEFKKIIPKKSLISVLTGSKRVDILCTSALTALADILLYNPYDKYNIDTVYIKGTGYVSPDNILLPDLTNQNNYYFNLDKDSTKLVFKSLRNKVSFVFIGNELPNIIKLTKNDFYKFDELTYHNLHLTVNIENELINKLKDKKKFEEEFYNIFPEYYILNDNRYYKNRLFLNYIDKYLSPYSLTLIYVALYPHIFDKPIIFKLDNNIYCKQFDTYDKSQLLLHTPIESQLHKSNKDIMSKTVYKMIVYSLNTYNDIQNYVPKKKRNSYTDSLKNIFM